MVPVPEGSRAVLLRRGRFDRTLGPGNHIVVPWIVVSHIVTTRETPFDAPSTEIPTRDDVRTSIDILMTFRIESPERFVFTISAADFDQVCQATCQEAVRLLLRAKVADDVLDLGEADFGTATGGDRRGPRAVRRRGRPRGPHRMSCHRPSSWHHARRVDWRTSKEPRRRSGTPLRSCAKRTRRSSNANGSARQEAIELEAANEVTRLVRLEDRLRDVPERGALGRGVPAARRGPGARRQHARDGQRRSGERCRRLAVDAHAAGERGLGGQPETETSSGVAGETDGRTIDRGHQGSGHPPRRDPHTAPAGCGRLPHVGGLPGGDGPAERRLWAWRTRP